MKGCAELARFVADETPQKPASINWPLVIIIAVMKGQLMNLAIPLCNRRLDNGARVIYLVVGDKPAPGYKRPERRRHEMPFIAHDFCFDKEFELQPTKNRAAIAPV